MSVAFVKLVKKTICPCGGSVLWDDIPLGKVYKIHPETLKHNWNFGCGDCGNIIKVSVVDADNDDGTVGPLPVDLFNWTV